MPDELPKGMHKDQIFTSLHVPLVVFIIGCRTVGWLEDEVENWLKQRITITATRKEQKNKGHVEK